MRRILLTLVLLLGLCLCGGAQTVKDSSYRTAAYIKSDGTVQDSSYRTIGHIKSDGTVQDGRYRTVGHIKDDGTIQDGNYRTVGYAKDVPAAKAAIVFFFKFFE